MSEPLERTPSAFRLNLEQQKKRARDLLKAAKAGESGAIERLAAAHGAPLAAPQLADAQFAIARELRFSSWARLKSHVMSMDRHWTAIAHGGAAADGDMRTLHLRCGHDIEQTLREAGFAGDFHAHITPYCQGPVTKGPDRHARMARFIVDAFGDPGDPSSPFDYERVLREQRTEDELLLTTAHEYERVVIWMEHDSWDQLILVRLLAHYAGGPRPRQLELVAVAEYPGGTRFVGIGQLPPEALRLLWTTRRAVTPAQLALGAEAWTALASPDPRALAALARSGTPPLPILAPALHRHLRELPSLANGLGLTEQIILQILLETGTATLDRVFWMLQNEREPLPYLGDWGVAHVVRELERAVEPPLTRTVTTPGERTFANRLTLTAAGRAVLAGERSWQRLGPRPRWVGGVHVWAGESDWRWDERAGTVSIAARR